MRAVRGCLLSSLAIVLSAVLICQSSPVQRGYVESGDFGSLRSKKPFCNAFTGCGRKRSDPAMAEDELMNLLAQRIQGIRDQVSLPGWAESG